MAVAGVVGSLLGGEIGQWVSLRAALAVGVALNLLSVLPTIFSELRTLRTVPATVAVKNTPLFTVERR